LAKLIDRKIAGPEKIQTIAGLIETQIETWIEEAVEAKPLLWRA